MIGIWLLNESTASKILQQVVQVSTFAQLADYTYLHWSAFYQNGLTYSNNLPVEHELLTVDVIPNEVIFPEYLLLPHYQLTGQLNLTIRYENFNNDNNISKINVFKATPVLLYESGITGVRHNDIVTHFFLFKLMAYDFPKLVNHIFHTNLLNQIRG